MPLVSGNLTAAGIGIINNQKQEKEKKI